MLLSLAAGYVPKPMFLPSNFSLSMLRQRRKANGFQKQSDVATYVGRHVQTIKRLESQGVLPLCDARDWVKLQNVYGLTIEQFAQLQETLKDANPGDCMIYAVSEPPSDYQLEN